MKPLYNIQQPEVAIAADGIQTYDLSVNPLSVILLELRPLNDTGTLANFQNPFEITKALNRVSVNYLGQSIVSMRGEDLAALNWLRYGMLPWDANNDNVDNERRCVVLPLMLGKFPYDMQSGFPATRRGELTLECDFDIADTGYDGLRFAFSTIEILDAKFKEFERKVQVTQTFGATGTNDVDLYAGNDTRGVLLFGTTSFDGATPVPSWGRIRVLLDNQEAQYANIDWEVLMQLPQLMGRTPSMTQHKHTVNAAGAGIEETASVFDADDNLKGYAFIDFDPTRDDAAILETGKATRFQIRAEAETADAVRAIQIEKVPTSFLQRVN